MPIRFGRLTRRLLAAATTVALVACTSGGTAKVSDDPATADVGKCVAVDVVVSPEKYTLMVELAKAFNGAKDAKVAGQCIVARPRRVSSGSAAQLLVDGWPDPATNGVPPVVWSPAASAWGAIVNQRAGRVVAPPARPFMVTPLVLAMPKPMADALGYPANPVGFADIVKLAQDPQGWARYGHPEWGPFRLGKTNPTVSTSGLNFTLAEYYAATGKRRDLSLEDLARPDVGAFAAGVESSVVHYGDTTLTFLDNWYRADARGTALTYASAVAVEEKSILDYNAGNPDGILDPGEVPKPPRVPLVAVYPAEGTLYSDNPFFVLDAPWVTDRQKQAAAVFQDFVLRPENQAKVLAAGFRPGNPSVPLGAPITTANGVDPAQPQSVLEVPAPAVLAKALETWGTQRKTARVLLVLDVSGSMGDPAVPNGSETKLDLAKRAVLASLAQFKDDDLVGLRIFSTGLSRDPAVKWLDLVPIGRIGSQREGLRARIAGLVPVQGTPLYDVAAASYTEMVDDYDPAKINAVVLLTDGRNDDGNRNDDGAQLQGLVDELTVGAEGARTTPVRVFTIGYGKDADLGVLRQIAQASNAAAYDASNPSTIEQVFTAVISNF
jgi:Ca-activated chloride channel family protein